MNITKRLVGLLAVTAIAVGCGSDDDDTNAAASPSTTMPSATGPCGDSAIESCDTFDCVFDPATIDCAAACANIAAVCGSNQCTDQCTGMEQDEASCTVGCDALKATACTNLTFGCYAQSNDCNTVGNCVASEL